MVDVIREIERKYDVGRSGQLPDLHTALLAVPGVTSVAEEGILVLDALYYDTEDHRLAADGITLRRRTGGNDAGWHLKLPVAAHGPLGGADGSARDEIRAPLSEGIPRALAALVRSRVRDKALVPLARLRSEREVRQLRDAAGIRLAEVTVDHVTAQRLEPAVGESPARDRSTSDRAVSGEAVPWEVEAPMRWTEVETELAEGGDPVLLDVMEKRLTEAGLRRASAGSKLARLLAGTTPGARRPGVTEPAKQAKRRRKADRAPAGPATGLTAGDHVLNYVRTQVRAMVELDPAVRRDVPDAVHRMRVATRRLRSCFRSYGKVLDRTVTDALGAELKWLAAELGVDRDREVLTARLQERVAELPRSLLLGPVRGRLRTFGRARRSGSRRRLIAVLDGGRYLALLDGLDAVLADPPLVRPDAAGPPEKVISQAVRRDFDRLATDVGQALAAPAGPDRDRALHEARKAAKRVRYAAEAARPAFGRPAREYASRMTAVQELLGEHQDSVMAREALRELALQAHTAGEPSFTYGVLYGREEACAAEREQQLPALWAEVSGKEHRTALGSA